MAFLAAGLPSLGNGAILNVTPAAGETVTVDASAPNPDTGRVFLPGVEDVTVNVLAGAEIDHAGDGAIRLGAGSTADNAGAVRGANNVVDLRDGGSVRNRGTITATGSTAVLLGGDANITHDGTISAGGEAIRFTGSFDNRVTLEPDAVLIGAVNPGGGRDTLVLGGDAGSGSFHMSDVGGGRQFRNFETGAKEGQSTWTMTGSGSNQNWTIRAGTMVQRGPIRTIDVEGGTLDVAGAGRITGVTTLRGGTLSLADSDSLTGTLRVLGGTVALQNAGPFADVVRLGASDGSTRGAVTLDARGNAVELTGGVVGDGDVTLASGGPGGGGSVTLSASTAFTGDLVVLHDGTTALLGAGSVGPGNTLRFGGPVGAGNAPTARFLANTTLGGLAGAGRVELAPGVDLTLDADADGNFGGVLVGGGTLVKTGDGVLTLGGDTAGTPGGLAGGVDLRAGGLLLGTDGALGVGGLAVNGDAGLASTDDARRVAAPVSIAVARALTVGGARGLRLDGPVSGGGSLRKTGAGTLALGTANTHGGGTRLDGGTLELRNDDALGTGPLAVGGDATVAPAGGDRSIDNAVSIGGGSTLTLGGAGADGLTLGGSLTGAGGLVKAGAGVVTLTGNGNHGGGTTISGGTLIADGSLASVVTVLGGRLAGTGTLGGIDARGGRVAPGRSIGTLRVDGDVAFSADATYEVEVDGDGRADLLDASGTATLVEGTTLAVAVTGGGGLIEDGDGWTVLRADGGLTDGGARVTGSFAGFRFTGVAGSNDYRVTAEAVALAPAFADPDAHAAATALDNDASTAAPGLAAFIQATRNRTHADAERFLAAANPRAVPAARLASRRVTDRFHAALGAHLRGPEAGRAAGTREARLASAAATPHALAVLLAEEEAADNPLGAIDAGWGGFAAAYGVYDDREAGVGRLGSQAVTRAAQVGVDHALGPDLVVGLGFGYARTDLEFSGVGLGDLGGSDIDSHRIGPYLGYARGPWSADASLTWALHDHAAERRAPGRGEPFAGSYRSEDVAVFLGGGYDLDLGGWALRPEAGLQYVHTWADGYAETGGPGGLAVDDSEADSLRSTLGLRVSRPFRLGRAVVTPRLTAGWAHEHLGDDDAPDARFVGGSTAFTVATAARSDDSVFYGAGVTARFGANASVDVAYLGESSDDARTDAVRVALRLDF